MPTGHHLSQCLHCLCEFICGDCILTICQACEARGHKGDTHQGCPECEREKLQLYEAMKEER